MAIPVTPMPEPGPEITESFVADRQKFWNGFTSFLTMGAAAVVVLLILMAIFLT